MILSIIFISVDVLNRKKRRTVERKTNKTGKRNLLIARCS
jgi:hypothetical protein